MKLRPVRISQGPTANYQSILFEWSYSGRSHDKHCLVFRLTENFSMLDFEGRIHELTTEHMECVGQVSWKFPPHRTL